MEGTFDDFLYIAYRNAAVGPVYVVLSHIYNDNGGLLAILRYDLESISDLHTGLDVLGCNRDIMRRRDRRTASQQFAKGN